MKHPSEYGDELATRLTVEKLLESCSEEEREILRLIIVEELTLAEIGEIIGQKYPRKDKDRLSGSGVRYIRDQVYARFLRKLMESDKGEE